MIHAKFQDHRTSGSGRCLKIKVMYMYIAPAQGQTTPGVNIFSLTVLFSQYSPLLQDFLH